MNRHLTILHLNDSHGYLDRHLELFWSGDHAEYRPAGGFSRLATVLKSIREDKEGAVMAFDCGDTFHGTHAVVRSRGEILVPILNFLRFDAMTAHWEFAYEPEQFRSLAGRLTYPMLAINCYDKETDRLVFPPSAVLEKNGLRLGIIGIASPIVDKVMPESFSKGLYFTLGNEELPRHIKRLRSEDKVDLVLVISHLGFPQEVKLAHEVSGIDILLGGHTHHRLYRPVLVNGTIIIQSGCHGSFLGRLEIDVDEGRISAVSHELITLDRNIAPEPQVEEMVRAALRDLEEETKRVVGRTATPLNRNTVLESTMDNLLLQSLLELTGDEVAFSNGWRYGAPVAAGPVTLNDLWNIIPVNPPVSTCELAGAEIRAMMEENLEHTFSRDPYNQMGGYVKRCLGLNLYFKVENPPGHRIQEIFIGNKPLDPDRPYRCTYVTSQGVPARFGSGRRNLEVRAIEAMEKYLAGNRSADCSLRGSVVAV